MSVLKNLVTDWMSSPATKKPTKDDSQQDDDMQRGVKRKAEVDPYDEIDDEDDVPQKTPSNQPSKARISSGTPGSGRARRGRPPSAKKSRQSRSSGAGNGVVAGEADNSKSSLVPVADMGNSDELLGDDKADKSNDAKSRSKPDSRDKSTTKNGESSTAAQKEEEQEQEQEDQEEELGEEHEVKTILDYRPSEGEKGAIELLVHWEGETVDEATWEPEEEIQKGAAETLYDFWKSKGGRARALFQDLQLPEEYRVFSILRHQKKQRSGFHLEVQWVGYTDSPVDTTWEPETKLKTAAPGPLKEYWDSVGGRDKFLAPRGRSKK